jgi:Sulfotransferase domain
MKLDEKTNYIVSGLERSGTSMIMQILYTGDIEISFNNSRKPDDNNPRGYFELNGGKIINLLINGDFEFDKYKGKFVKITAYGLKFLPPGKYKIIYCERNIEEVLDSMEKMMGMKDRNRDDTKKSFIKFNIMIKKEINNRTDTEILYVDYNDILVDPGKNIKKILYFLDLPHLNLDKMIGVVDKNLYRQRK